jgi:hypothetical protein
MAAKQRWHFEDGDDLNGEELGAGFPASRCSLTFRAFKEGNRGVYEKRTPVRFAPSLQTLWRNLGLMPANILHSGGVHRAFHRLNAQIVIRYFNRPLG